MMGEADYCISVVQRYIAQQQPLEGGSRSRSAVHPDAVWEGRDGRDGVAVRPRVIVVVHAVVAVTVAVAVAVLVDFIIFVVILIHELLRTLKGGSVESA